MGLGYSLLWWIRCYLYRISGEFKGGLHINPQINLEPESIYLKMSNTLFPIFLKTDITKFLIVGGGKVGLEKTETLLRQNPGVSITIVSVAFIPELLELIEKHSNIKHFEKPFDESDLHPVDIVITAINDPVISREIQSMANQRKLLVNAADQPDICNFYLGSIVKKGNLKVAISTNGKSPVMARRMREYFEEVIPDEIDETIRSLHQYRNSIKGDFQYKLNQLNHATKSLQAKDGHRTKKYMRIAGYVSLGSFLFLSGYILAVYLHASF